MGFSVLLRPGHLFAVGGISISAFLAGVFWFRPWPGKRADRFLAAVFACTTVSQAGFLVTSGFLRDLFPHLSRLNYPALFVMAPLFLFYVRSLTEPGFRLRAKDLLHFLPAALFTAAFSPFYFNTGEYKASFGPESPAPAYVHFLSQWTWTAICAFVIAYLVAVLLAIRRHQRRIRETFSDLSRIKLSWINRMMLFTLLCWCLIAAASVSFVSDRSGMAWVDTVPAILFAFLLFIGYKVLTQPAIYREADADAAEGLPAAAVRDPDPGDAERLAKMVADRMEAERLYADPELTLPALAERIGMPRNTLSRLINRSTGDNFYTFVNTYRVEEFKRLLRREDRRNHKMLVLALEAGFNSKATFNAAFKTIARMTPSQYKASMEVEESAGPA